MNTHAIDRKALQVSDWVLQRHKQSSFKPEIYFLDGQGTALCIKDFAHCNAFIRNTLGRWTVNKEAQILDELSAISGVPSLAGIIEGPALVIERLDAVSLTSPGPEKPPPNSPLTLQFFREASTLLATLHKNGITHGDIHRTNLLVDEYGRPSLIDFASALIQDQKSSRFKRWAWQNMARIDIISQLKLRQEYFPDYLLSPDEEVLIATQPKIYHLHNKLRVTILRPIKRFFRSN